MRLSCSKLELSSVNTVLECIWAHTFLPANCSLPDSSYTAALTISMAVTVVSGVLDAAVSGVSSLA